MTRPALIRPGRPATGTAKVMIPWRISPRLVERLRWAAMRQNIQPSTLLARLIERNTSPV